MAERDEVATSTVIAESHVQALKLELVAKLSPKAWRRSLLQIGQQIQAGETLAKCVETQRRGMPRELTRLFEQALLVPDPVGVVEDAVKIRHDTSKVWREFTAAITYPLLLFFVALSVTLCFNYCMHWVVDIDWMYEFELAGTEVVAGRLADQTHAIYGWAIATFWFILVLATVYFVGPVWAWTSVVGGLIIVGKPVRWIALQELLQRYRIFFAQGLDSVSTVRAVEASLSSSSQAVVARRIARQVESGMPIGEAIGNSFFADRLTRPIIRFLDVESHEGMDVRLGHCAEILRRITSERCQTLINILPLLAVLVVGTLILSSLLTYAIVLQPLVMLITSLA